MLVFALVQRAIGAKKGVKLKLTICPTVVLLLLLRYMTSNASSGFMGVTVVSHLAFARLMVTLFPSSSHPTC